MSKTDGQTPLGERLMAVAPLQQLVRRWGTVWYALGLWRRHGFRHVWARMLGRIWSRGPERPAGAVRERDEEVAEARGIVAEILDQPVRGGQDGAVIDVIVPVYKGLVETLRCLRSVLAAEGRQAFELVVVDDAGPDSELASCLQTIAAAGHLTLLRNAGNLGFVQSVNRGMLLHADRDVVLLNSDTEVNGNWLDRLQEAARSQDRVGTVTPFSNSGAICSYPSPVHDEPLPVGVSAAELDEICHVVNRRRYVELPTAVGFCMYIRRDCLRDVGLFDFEKFGKGYGEEVDFSLRATARGWRHLLAADTFVLHLGGTSFGSSRAALCQAARRTIDAEHPHFEKLVRSHVLADPARGYRERIDSARRARRAA